MNVLRCLDGFVRAAHRGDKRRAYQWIDKLRKAGWEFCRVREKDLWEDDHYDIEADTAPMGLTMYVPEGAIFMTVDDVGEMDDEQHVTVSWFIPKKEES